MSPHAWMTYFGIANFGLGSEDLITTFGCGEISMRANVCMDIHSEQPTSHQMLLKWFAPCSTRLGARSGSFFGYVKRRGFLFDDVSIMDDIWGYKPSNVIMVY